MFFVKNFLKKNYQNYHFFSGVLNLSVFCRFWPVHQTFFSSVKGEPRKTDQLLPTELSWILDKLKKRVGSLFYEKMVLFSSSIKQIVVFKEQAKRKIPTKIKIYSFLNETLPVSTSSDNGSALYFCKILLKNKRIN